MVDNGTIWTLVNACRPGPTGSDATAADTGAWVTATTYNENDRCTHAKSGHGQSVYRAKSTHLSAATREPEVGGTWRTYWELWAEGGEDGAGSGDVTGPASSTTDHIPTFYDTGGKRLKDSLVPINRVSYKNLTKFTGGVVDNELDLLSFHDYSANTYYSISPKRIHRATETISLMSRGMWKRNTTLPCGSLTEIDIDTTRFCMPALPFPHAAMSYANCSFIMPESWDGGELEAIFWGTTTTAGAGTVRMAISACVIADGDLCTLTGSPLEGVTLTAHEAAQKIMQSGPVAFTPSGWTSAAVAGGNKILFQICRYVAYQDTLVDDFYLTDVVIRYGVGDD